LDKEEYEKKKKAVVSALKLIDPKKPYGPDLFNAIARITVSLGIEAVCFKDIRGNPKIPEVLLIERSPKESAYPNQWHCPGSIMRPGEKIGDVFNRLKEKEFCTEIEIIDGAGFLNNTQEERGHILSLIYLCKLKGEKVRGEWFPINNLPENTVKHHSEMLIPMAAFKAFLK